MWSTATERQCGEHKWTTENSLRRGEEDLTRLINQGLDIKAVEKAVSAEAAGTYKR